MSARQSAAVDQPLEIRMNAKNTPGPWRFEASTKTIRSEPANYWLASIDSWDGAVDHQANARLIAAAPELLECLSHIRALASENAKGLDGYEMIAEWCDTLIAKARGEHVS
jgi:hypothetical protein